MQRRCTGRLLGGFAAVGSCHPDGVGHRGRVRRYGDHGDETAKCHEGFPPTGKPKVVVEVEGGVAHTVYATMPWNHSCAPRQHQGRRQRPTQGVDLAESTEYQEVY